MSRAGIRRVLLGALQVVTCIASAQSTQTYSRAAVDSDEPPRTGNWSSQSCKDPPANPNSTLSATLRWGMLDCAHAWNDSLAVWALDRGHFPFTQSIFNVFHGVEMASCGDLTALSNCQSRLFCTGIPAGDAIIDSFSAIHFVSSGVAITFSRSTANLAMNELDVQKFLLLALRCRSPIPE